MRKGSLSATSTNFCTLILKASRQHRSKINIYIDFWSVDDQQYLENTDEAVSSISQLLILNALGQRYP